MGWADPSTAITRANAHRIGTSAVALEPDETKEVLCLSPWTPTSANGGHQCLIAEAFAPTDPLPPHLDTTPFDPPGDRHVAQCNVTVLSGLGSQCGRSIAKDCGCAAASHACSRSLPSWETASRTEPLYS